MVREYKGSHSGEHGDGLVRSEFHEAMFGVAHGARLRGGQGRLRPAGPVQPGQDRPGARRWTTAASSASSRITGQLPIETALDWSEWGGFAAAAEMCNNNGACRARDAGVMCPSYRATGDEQHLTRGRANTLRLALIGPARARGACLRGDARDAGPVHLVQGLQARMPDRRRHGAHEDRVPAPLPEAPRAHAARPADRLSAALCALRRADRAAAQPAKPACRSLARARGTALRAQRAAQTAPLVQPSLPRDASIREAGAEVVLLVDTFNRYFEPENARAAERVLTARRLSRRQPRPGERPAAVLRADLSLGRARRRGAARGAADAGRACASSRGRNADRRARAVLPVDVARRIPGDPAGCPNQGARRARPALRGIRRKRARGGPLPARRWRRWKAGPRCCTGIATRRRSARSAPRSRRCS